MLIIKSIESKPSKVKMFEIEISGGLSARGPSGKYWGNKTIDITSNGTKGSLTSRIGTSGDSKI
jgi:hypothetical protein